MRKTHVRREHWPGPPSAATSTIRARWRSRYSVLVERTASSFYGLANGSGKARAARDGSLREPKTWRVLILSSGEIPTETKLAEDRGRKARGGQLVRMLDIPADRGRGFGVFDHGGPDNDAGALAKTLKQAAISAYGTAGSEFVRRIIAEGVDEIGETVQDAVAAFIETAAPTGSDGQIGRAAQRFGLIAAAGELATALKLVPWRAGEARAAAAGTLAQWIEGRGGTEPAEVRQAIEQVRLFIEQYGESRFEALDDADARPVNNRGGLRKGSGPDREWMIPPEVWKAEICNGLDPTLVARTLAERGMLLRAADGFQPVRKIDGANKRVYILTANTESPLRKTIHRLRSSHWIGRPSWKSRKRTHAMPRSAIDTVRLKEVRLMSTMAAVTIWCY
jgi:putative DNA primase/helicase